MFEATKGQRALSDLTIVLDALDIDHPDIIQGWIDKIAAELAATSDLLRALQNLLAWANIQDHHSLQAIRLRDNAHTAIKQAKP